MTVTGIREAGDVSRQTLLGELQGLLGGNHVLTGTGLEAYERDWRKR